MFRKALFAGLTLIMAGGLTAAIGSTTAIAATAAQACPASTVIEIEQFAFNPSAIAVGQSSTATLTALNCTDLTQQTTENWSARFADSSVGTAPAGCPVVDPLTFAVTFPPLEAVSNSVEYSVPASCTATELIVTADIYGQDGTLLAEGTAVLVIAQPIG